MSKIGFLEWIKSLFGKPKRLVARLESIPEGDIDTVYEVVDTSGGPLREGHRRIAIRDRRLLPKKRLPSLSKRKRLMKREEAGRLFSATMRTHNRNIRDLLPDEDQLARYSLPVWRTEEDLARDLGITPGHLRFFSIHREMEKAPHYVMFSIPKRSGGERILLAPKSRLRKIQRTLLKLLVDRLPLNENAHGFRKGRSIRTGAEIHRARRVVINMDIRDFFKTIHFGRVRGYLISLGYGYAVATTLAVLMTESERQPVRIDGAIYYVPVSNRYCIQGAPTSPGICNAIMRKADARLSGFARALGFNFTRYADDITFSGDNEEAVIKVVNMARRILREEGFALNPEKTRIARSGRCQRVTGVVVNRDIGLSRKERRLLRAEGHRLGSKAADLDRSKLNILKGKLAYLKMLNPEQHASVKKTMSSLFALQGRGPVAPG